MQKNGKKRTHITIPGYIDTNIRDYCKNKNIEFSDGVAYLCDKALNDISLEKKIELNNTLLEKIYSREIYIRDLIEQLYADLEISDIQNPKDNKCLQTFKKKKLKDVFND